MGKYTFIFLLSFFFTIPVSAANIEWKTGYIVLLDNDTIKGEVALQGKDKYYLECLYRKDKQQPIKTYTPIEIKAYGFDEGLSYISLQLNTPSLNGNYFVQHLFSGMVSLYYIQPGEKSIAEYIIARKDSERVLTLNDVTHKSDKNNEIKRNRARLSAFLNDCVEIQETINKLKGNQEEYIHILQEYHNYIHAEEPYVIYTERKPKKAHYLTPFIGPRYVKTHYNIDWYSNRTLAPVIGLDYSISLRNYSDKWKFHTGIDFSYFSLSSEKESFPIKRTYKFNSFWINNNIAISYNIVSLSWKPFLTAGVFHEVLLPTTNQFGNNLNFDYDKYSGGVFFGGGINVPLKKGTQIPIRFLWQETFFGKDLNPRQSILLHSFLNLTVGYTFKL